MLSLWGWETANFPPWKAGVPTWLNREDAKLQPAMSPKSKDAILDVLIMVVEYVRIVRLLRFLRAAGLPKI